MEGLIPLICRSIKRSKTRSQYELLSSGTAETLNIQDYYQAGYNMSHHHHATPPPDTEKKAAHPKRPQRHKSFHLEYYSAKPEKLIRFGSHKMFSCMNGA